MFKKKRPVARECTKPSRKVPLITAPCLNLPDELRPANDIKSMVRSIELRKPPPNPYKKSVSRKSTCKSVKQGGTLRVVQQGTIMQTFKELKQLLHDQSRSKSKSPASCKSRSTKKGPFKRKSYATLCTNPNSEVNLTLKLQRTIKHLNQTDFFRDEDSILPIRSSSDQISDEQRTQRLCTDREQEIDLAELRNFCSTVKLEKCGFKNLSSFREDRAALKIQRAWRQYQTRRLVNRYVYLSRQQEELMDTNIPLPITQDREEEAEEGERQAEEESDSGSDVDRLQVPEGVGVSSEELYGEGEGRVRHISNLQEVGVECEQVVKRMKLEELQKWNQIIEIIAHSRSDSPQQLQKLLQQLTEQSELNKKELEAKANSILAKRQKSQGEQEEKDPRIPLLEHQREYSSSDHSAALEEYDSKKYIEYLDGDIFPLENDHSSCEPERGTRISKRKQELLLQELRHCNLPIKLGESSLYRSESVKGLENVHRRQNSKSSSRSGLRKSTSEKVLRCAMEDMNLQCGEEQEEGELNLDLLTRQFLEGSDPSADNFDMVYSEEKLRSKLAELTRLKQEQSEDTFQRDEEEEEEEVAQLKRSQPALQLQQGGGEIKIEDGTPEKLHVEVVQHEIPSDSDEDDEKGEACAAAVLNTLLLQALRDIASTQRLSSAFKAYSLSLKSRVRKVQGKKKKGFPTSKAEIELFLEGLLRFLSKEQPHIFRNLEVSTGPSALEMLRYMHQSGEEQGGESEGEDEDESNVMVIPNRVFDAFWHLKQRSIVIEVPQHFDQSNAVIFRHQFELLKSFNKIFYRSLFDTFNECLDCQRNFGQYGRPFPWKRAAVFDHHRSDASIQGRVEQARKKMLELSVTYCGLIIEKEDMVNSINEDYVKQVHQDRLSRMLASDLIEAEDRWIFYDDEETEILVEVASALYTELLIEVIEELWE